MVTEKILTYNEWSRVMKKRNFISVIFIVMCLLPSMYAKEEISEADAVYEKIRNQIQSGDVKADYKSLRLSCADSKYSCEESRDVKNEIYKLLVDEKFIEALKEIDKSLQKIFVDIELHYFAFIANVETDKKEKAEFHKTVIGGLLDSIQEDKNGRSEKDAFTVINTREIYVFLQFSGMNVHGQSLRNKDGHSYDVMTCTREAGEEPFDVYFNVDIPMNSLSKLLGAD